MRTLEVRRHSIREKPSPHLSQEGVALARRVGEEMGPFDLVLTSRLPRAFETAIAMGFAVDRQVKKLGTGHLPKVGGEVDFARGFSGWAEAVRRGGKAAKHARRQAKLWRRIARELPDDGRALLIGHEGIMEGGVLGCLPDLDVSGWGPNCRYCEGVRLFFDGERFVEVELLRVDPIE